MGSREPRAAVSPGHWWHAFSREAGGQPGNRAVRNTAAPCAVTYLLLGTEKYP